MNPKSRLAALVSIAVLVIAAVVYFLTLTPTVPFWDSGEFIAVSKILGVPHPPGTPFFVMIGRVATLIPYLPTAAQRVNGLSAIAAALCVFLTYLSTLRMLRVAQGGERQPWHEWAAVAGSAVGALLFAFSDNFWENSIEAEVYQMMSLASILVFWLGLKWWEDHEQTPSVMPLLLATYVMWLSVGLHLGVGVMGLPLFVLAMMVDWKVGVLFMMPFLSLLRVPAGLENMGGAVLLFSTVAFVVYGYQKKLPMAIAAGGAVGIGVGLLMLLMSSASQVQAQQLNDFFAARTLLIEICAIATIALLAAWFVFEPVRRQPWLLGLLVGIGAAVGIFFATSDATFSAWAAVLAALAVVVPTAILAAKHREGRILFLALFLMIAGYSTHLYLPIRANLHPAINEGAPATWDRLRDLLERKQYGEMHMEVRRAELPVQLNKEFWRYCRRQFTLFGEDDWSQVEAYGAQHAGQPGAAGFFARIVYLWRLLLPPNAALPLLLGFAGGFYAWFREKKGFAYNFVFLGLNTAGLIVFLNFSPHEVRDRDYFFQSGYHAFAMWIGFGVTWLIGWVRESFGASRERQWATIGTIVLLALMPAFLLKDLWFRHDRSHNYIARDYAYDMLAPLKPNSFIFTNGDNDTFPLWYIQQVEGFRKDVRIVNLSLLNTDWYIKQLKDEDPKVPIDLPDSFIESRLGQGVFTDENGNPHYGADGRPVFTNEYMVHHIMDHARNADGTWKMQPYFAVTVPEHYGYERNFALQGLVCEVRNDTTLAGIDVEATKKALYQTFMYRGLFTADGSWDTKVYKDDNAETLSRNFAAAHLQLANWYHHEHDLKGAIAEMERVRRMFPNYTDAQLQLGQYYVEDGDTAKAMDFFRSTVQRDPGNPEARYLYGAMLAMRGDVDNAMREFDAAILLEPDYGQPYIAAYYTLRQTGQVERSLTYLERWVEAHPQDAQAAAMLQAERASAGRGAQGRSAIPVPPPGGTLP